MCRQVDLGIAVLLALLLAGIAAVPTPAALVPDDPPQATPGSPMDPVGCTIVFATEFAPEQEAGKPIDVVICLDVSSSMNGLIDSAKAKLWDIVNDLAMIKPTPQLRVGLYSYGHTTYDPKAGWVRKESDLVTDLDTIYQKLFALTISGGTEYVARVSRDAVEQQQWSADKDALKIIFVAGNEPATQDKEVTLNEVADKAKAKGIVINPIYCGNAQDIVSKGWSEFATLAGGKFMSIDQNRGIVAVSTPMDKELTELGSKLSGTYVRYGKEGATKQANQQAQNANAAGKAGRGGSGGVAAARAATMAGGLYRNDDWDLVDRMKNDPKFDLAKVQESELSEEMRKMTPEERVAHVKKMTAEREALQKQISELNVQRQAYLKEEMKKNPTAADKAFDDAVRGALREQAAVRGIKIPD